MGKPVFSFEADQFNRIFPYHILVDHELRIVSAGSLLAHMVHLEKSQLFSTTFQLKFPVLQKPTFDAFKELTNQSVALKFADPEGNNYILDGQVEYLAPQNQLLFIGVPALSAVEDENEDYVAVDEAERENAIAATTTIKGKVKTNGQHNSFSFDGEGLWRYDVKEIANRLFFLFKNLDTGVVLEGKDHKIILVNAKFCKFFGIKESPEQLIGMDYTIASRVSKHIYKNPDEAISRIYEILEKREPVLQEMISMSDGRYFKRDYVPVFLDGKYEGHLWQYVDVTEQTIAENKLEEQKTFYENVLNNIPGDIVAFSPNHEYQFINPMAIKDPELRKWMIGKRDEDFCERRNKPMTVAEGRRNLFNKVVAAKKLHFWEEKLTTPNGGTEYHLRNMYPVLNEQNEVIQVIGFGLNVTEHKKMEEQVKLNEKRYRDLFNYSQAFICTHDLEGRLLTVNPAVCELLGYYEEEIKGRLISDFLPKHDVKSFREQYLEKVIQDGSSTGVFRVIGRNNKKSYLLYKNFKVEEENTEPYVIGFSQDITDRIKAEKELLQTKKLTDDANKAKETFLANMSHEIRTPMTGILGIANLLSKTGLDEQQKKFTKLISESANNLLTIVNDVLDIEKITAGKLDLEFIPFKIEDKVFTTLQSFQFKAEDKNINLLLNSTLPDDLVVVGDPFRLGQILNNLLSNAMKFTAEGAITLNMDYSKNDDTSITVEISVHDTGIGIKEDKLSDIFRPFTQASSDTTRKFGGTGLGLTICKNLVEMQGGKISVQSKINEGTTFSFFIPYEKGTEAMLNKEEKDDVNYKDLAAIKILVAEDVDLNKFLVRHILEAWGCEVTMANNGREAVEKVKRHHYDLVLMDIQMPEMDGITATRLIRGLGAPEQNTDSSSTARKTRSLNIKDVSNVPIIAITANALKGDGQRYLDLGMNGYITKPYTEEKLFHAINQVIKNNDKLKLKIAPGNMPVALAEPDEKLYDMAMIISLGKDDNDFISQITNLFIDSMPENIKLLEEADRENNIDLLSRTAHKMKAQIDLFNIQSIKEPIRELENTKERNERTSHLIAVVKDTLYKVFGQLRDYLNDLT